MSVVRMLVKRSHYYLKVFIFTFPLLWLVVAVELTRRRSVFGVGLLVPVCRRLPLSLAHVVELIFQVQLHVHLGLHPQPLHPTQILAVAGCGGVHRPVRLHVIGQRIA